MSSDVLLLQGPSRFDRVEVRRVRRLIDDPDTLLLAGSRDSRIVMSAKVVHYEHVAAVQAGQQAPLQPGDETICSSRSKLSALNHPSRQANCSEKGEVFAPVHGSTIDVFAALLDPGVATPHGEIQARFIEKDEIFYGDAPNSAAKVLSLPNYVRPHLLQWTEPFFLTT